MWRPPERIRWEPDPGIWPSADEAASARLFQPVNIGPIELESSTWVPAMVPWRATGDGEVTDVVVVEALYCRLLRTVVKPHIRVPLK